jgi:predicted dehydrogenase
VAGAGFIGAVHARAYARVPDVELVGIADPLAEKAGALAKETGSRPFRDYAELLREGLDIISVCLPPQPHLAAAEAAAAAGVHVLMEKPIARTVAEAEQMVAACRRAGVFLMTGFTHHFYPEMREAKRLLDSGAVGRPLSVLDNMSITYAFVLPWYRDRDIAGGGVFMCNAVHGLDRASWVLGQRITSVAAQVEPTVGSKGEDYGSALARFDGGAQGTFFQHWGEYRTLTCELLVYGDEGMLHVRSWDSIELLRGGRRTIERYYHPDESFPERTMRGMVAELSEMADAVRAGRAPSPAGEDGARSVALVQAIYRASAERAWVDV